MERLIFHVDVNSAFLSWEAARRVAAGEPDLRLIPSAIGGDRDKRTGVVLAKSIPAKRRGIKTGEPIAQALRKCPELQVARPDFRLYERCSRAFMDICRRYAPVVEKYSIDECFLDMSGTAKLYPDPVAIAHTIKNEIRDTLGFTVNIGIGDCKLLAKMAGDFEKPDKVHTLFSHEIAQKMWPLPVGELFTVGRSTAEKLIAARICTIGDLARQDVSRLQYMFGDKPGRHLHNYANGIDPSPVLAEPEEAKGYSISTTLEEDVTERVVAHRVLLQLSDSVTARMRRDGCSAGCVAVTARASDFKTRSHQRHLDAPTDITAEVHRTACELFDELWDKRTPLRLLGLSLTDLSRGTPDQISLFEDVGKRERERKLDRAVDAIRGKFGMDTIVRASSFGQTGEVGKKYRAQMETEEDKQ